MSLPRQLQRQRKERTVSLNGRYIRGFITPKYDSDQAESKPVNTPGKSVSTVAHEVIAGQWGEWRSKKKSTFCKWL